jgi:chitin disaccharide deacetylase
VNEAVERAHREGILSTASLMVAGPAAADAVRRARTLPRLGVGLHLVVIEGPAVLPDSAPGGQFSSDQLRLGVEYFFKPAARRRVGAEVAAQYRAFAATGLRLDHANAHKHMHLHPTVGRMLIETGREFGLQAIRIPAEPPDVIRSCGETPGIGARAMYLWTGLLRAQARRAGLRMNDHIFGLAWSGRMTADRVLRLAPHLPAGLSEIYFHPATARDAALRRLMPEYDHEGELDSLLNPEVHAALQRAARLRGWDA